MKYIVQTSIIALFISILGCDSEHLEGGPEKPSTPTEKPFIPDPPDTKIVDMISPSVRLEYIEGAGVGGGIWIENGNFKGRFFSDALFLPLGEIDGLGNITSIPRTGWVKSTAVVEHHGYIAYLASNRYWRIFIDKKDSHQIIVKYQTPFQGSDQQTISLSDSLFQFSKKGGSRLVYIQNSTLFPVEIITESWCRVYPIYVDSIPHTPCHSFEIICDPNQTQEERNDVLTVKGPGGATAYIRVTQEAGDPPIPPRGKITFSQEGKTLYTPVGEVFILLPEIKFNRDWIACDDVNNPWCKVYPTSGTANQEVGIYQEANTSGQARSTDKIWLYTTDKNDSTFFYVTQTDSTFFGCPWK